MSDKQILLQSCFPGDPLFDIVGGHHRKYAELYHMDYVIRNDTISDKMAYWAKWISVSTVLDSAKDNTEIYWVDIDAVITNPKVNITKDFPAGFDVAFSGHAQPGFCSGVMFFRANSLTRAFAARMVAWKKPQPKSGIGTCDCAVMNYLLPKSNLELYVLTRWYGTTSGHHDAIIRHFAQCPPGVKQEMLKRCVEEAMKQWPS